MSESKKITSLTEEQKAIFPHQVKKWTEIGLSTGDADFEKSIEYAKEAYTVAGLEHPKNFFMFDSPISCGVAYYLLKKDESLWTAGNDRVNEMVKEIMKDLDAADKAVNGAIKEEIRNSVWVSCYGSQDAGWLSFYDTFLQFGIEECKKLEPLMKLAEVCGWWIPCDINCLFQHKPDQIHLNEQNQLHNPEGPAISYRDGFALYYVNGVEVPDYVVNNPELITVEDIEAETNAEVRRIKMERYRSKDASGLYDAEDIGYDAYIRDCGAVVVHHVTEEEAKFKGMIDSKLLVKSVDDDEDIVFLDMVNSTPEPDGRYKRYLSRIDPTAYNGEAGTNAYAAQASRWRMGVDGSELVFKKWQDYIPLAES